MLTRSTAWFLIVLAASPFTAPFSTCSLSTLRTAPAPQAYANYAKVFVTRPESVEQSDTQQVPGTLLDEDQFKDLTLIATTTVNPPFIGVAIGVGAVHRISFIRTPLITLRL